MTRTKIAFKAVYQHNTTQMIHTDYIVTESEDLARQYANSQKKPYNIRIESFEKIAASDIKVNWDSSLVEL